MTSSYADINECGEAEMDRCDRNATCVNNIGSYDCMCDPGYTGDGFNCTSKLLIINCISIINLIYFFLLLQISMSVNWGWTFAMCCTLSVVTRLAVMSAPVSVVLMEMEQTALVR